MEDEHDKTLEQEAELLKLDSKETQETNETKECMFCAETIKFKAKICRFCNREQVEPKQETDPVVKNESETQEKEALKKKSSQFQAAVRQGDLSRALFHLSNLPNNLTFVYEAKFDNLKRNSTTAFLLLLFLGPFGVHKFYLKNTRAGIFMLILSCLIVGLLITVPVCIINFFTLGSDVEQCNNKISLQILGEIANSYMVD